MTKNIENESVEVKRGRPSIEPMEYSTLDMNSKLGRIAQINARRTAMSLAQQEAEPLNVVNVMAVPSNRAQSGNPCQNTYLFLDDGRILFSQSNGVAATVNEIMEAIDYDFTNTTNGYVTVILEVTELQGGKTYKQFKLLDM